jgi:two-component system, chemotaxis family, chemotaxis protein CheY
MTDAGIESLRALVVEDNVHMRALIRSVLYALGFKIVLDADNGERAFAILKEEAADLVLADLSMPVMDGIAFTRQVRTSPETPNPYVPIIMVTGHTERRRVEAARDAGITEFLAKPMTVQKLLQRVLEIVERPRPFVRCTGYFGPDRRRRSDDPHNGPWRRKDDRQQEQGPA